MGLEGLGDLMRPRCFKSRDAFQQRLLVCCCFSGMHCPASQGGAVCASAAYARARVRRSRQRKSLQRSRKGQETVNLSRNTPDSTQMNEVELKG